MIGWPPEEVALGVHAAVEVLEPMAGQQLYSEFGHVSRREQGRVS